MPVHATSQTTIKFGGFVTRSYGASKQFPNDEARAFINFLT
jgi:hypothetical protein